MKVQKVIQGAEKKIEYQDFEAKEIDAIRDLDLSDPVLTDLLTNLLIKEIERDG